MSLKFICWRKWVDCSWADPCPSAQPLSPSSCFHHLETVWHHSPLSINFPIWNWERYYYLPRAMLMRVEWDHICKAPSMGPRSQDLNNTTWTTHVPLLSASIPSCQYLQLCQLTGQVPLRGGVWIFQMCSSCRNWKALRETGPSEWYPFLWRRKVDTERSTTT